MGIKVEDKEAGVGAGGNGSEVNDLPLGGVIDKAEGEQAKEDGGNNDEARHLAVDALAPVDNVHGPNDPDESKEVGEDPDGSGLAEKIEGELGLGEVDD